MKKNLKTLLLAILVLIGSHARADEGMWIPILLKKYNIEEMQKAGFKLTAKDIYDVNQACLKDAVVGLGREGREFSHFCTGELISDKGLMVTNHHCGYGVIQSHSSLEHDYLKDGFWAKSKKEELLSEGITASFLVSMTDVSSQVLNQIDEKATENERQKIIQSRIREIEKKAEENTHYRANVKAYFSGNQYFLSVYEIFKDVRLVGAPPSAIGKFGGDTDNWMWPRHTGDFAMFRIYADKNNKPAPYSENNVPLKPKKSFKISLKGVNAGDFTMVFGYPGTTTEYLSSYALKLVAEVSNPHKIKIRTKKLDLIRADMDQSPLVRIQYAAKYAGISNGWKKWQGELKGLKRIHAIERKTDLENQFRKWSQSSERRKHEYGEILNQFKNLYQQISPIELARNYALEAGLMGAEIVGLSRKFGLLLKNEDAEKTKAKLEMLKQECSKFFKNFNPSTDKKLLAATLQMYSEEISDPFLPDELKNITKKYKGDFNLYAEKAFAKSIFSDQKKLEVFLENYKDSHTKKIQKDPIFVLASSILDLYRSKIAPDYNHLMSQIDKLQRSYMAGLMEMQPQKIFYPDANSTFRVHYGKVAGYKARNAINFEHYTTLEGIMEKNNPDIYDYQVPEKLKELYHSKNFGDYANSKGEMPVCFVATNHTTGGNSGSPVLNAEGELIGLNFDRAWEGVMSDLMYESEICRNISLDIRYVLFIVDKFAGATYLLDEMNIVK